MPVSFSLGFSRLTGVIVAASWLCVAGPAWAGGGGADLTSLNDFISRMCPIVGLKPCPQLPTISQAALEFAGLANSTVEQVRAFDNDAPAVNAGNPPTDAPTLLVLGPFNPSKAGSSLGFVAVDASTAARPVQPSDPGANNFFYAVTSPSLASGQPDTLNLFYDDTLGTNHSFTKGGQPVATISVPLAVLNKNNTERPLPILLQIVASCNGNETCLTANAMGDFSGNGNQQTKTAASLGINFVAMFGPSAAFSQPHLIFEVQIPLLVTQATDFPYFYNHATLMEYPLSPFVPTAFIADDLGTKVGGSPIGIAPSAAPLCPSTTNCSTNPPAAVFPLCASLPNGAGTPVPSVAAFYAISTGGEALISAPLTPTTPIKCPF